MAILQKIYILSFIVLFILSACDKENPDRVSVSCTFRSGDIDLIFYINIKYKIISVMNKKTNKWDALRSIWARIYDDQFQADMDVTGKYGFLIDRRTGGFHYSAAGLYQARNADPVGDCKKAPYREPPPLPGAFPQPPAKF